MWKCFLTIPSVHRWHQRTWWSKTKTNVRKRKCHSPRNSYQKCSHVLFVTRFPVQLCVISWAATYNVLGTKVISKWANAHLNFRLHLYIYYNVTLTLEMFELNHELYFRGVFRTLYNICDDDLQKQLTVKIHSLFSQKSFIIVVWQFDKARSLIHLCYLLEVDKRDQSYVDLEFLLRKHWELSQIGSVPSTLTYHMV